GGEEGGGGEEGQGQAGALDHAPGVEAHRACAGAVEGREAEDLVDPAALHVPQAPVELEDLAAGERVGKGHALGQEGEDGPGRRIQGRERGVADQHLAGGRLDETGRGLQRRRLSRPVRAQERHHRARAHYEVEGAHRGVRAERLRERTVRDHARALRPRVATRTPAPTSAAEASSPEPAARARRPALAGTAGRRGGRASGASSVTPTGWSTGNVRSAAATAAAAKPREKRSAAVRLPRKWSNTLVSRYGRSLRPSPSRSGSSLSDQ